MTVLKSNRLRQQSDLAARIRTEVLAWTRGRLRDLVVEFQDSAIVIRGRARSFHAKQLAICGVHAALEGRRHRPVHFSIVVESTRASSNEI